MKSDKEYQDSIQQDALNKGSSSTGPVEIPEDNNVSEQLESVTSANILCNYMTKIEYLKAVIRNMAFIPRYVEENLEYLNVQDLHGKSLPRDVIRAVGINRCKRFLPYMRIRSLTDSTGELFHEKKTIENPSGNQTIEGYNCSLSDWDRDKGKAIKEQNGYVFIDEYVNNTVSILKTLLRTTSNGNEGQEQLNKAFVSKFDSSGVDERKVAALKTVFVKSKVAMIYGAAGTGKTTLMNYISDLMEGRKNQR